MRPTWETPGLDLVRRFSRRGRTHLAMKRALLHILAEEERSARIRRFEEAVRADRETLEARFEGWDQEESRRIESETVEDMATLYPDLSRAERRARLSGYVLTRDLPIVPEVKP